MITVQIEGKAADRYRAYAKQEATRKPNREDLLKAGAKAIELPPGARIKYLVDAVVQEGLVTVGARTEGDVTHSVVSLSFGSVVDRVVFYKQRDPKDGELAEEGEKIEHVVGSAEVFASGGVEFEFVDPDSKDVVIDAAELG